MAYQNLQDCLDAIEQGSIKAFNDANNAFNDVTIKSALNQMRIQGEIICQALIFKKAQSQQEALSIINGCKDFQNYIDELNSIYKLNLFTEKLQQLQNKISNNSHIEAKDILSGIIKTFFPFLKEKEKIPLALQQAMNGVPLDPETRTERAKLYEYRDKLRNEYPQPVLKDEGITLQDLYIEPDIHFWDKSSAPKPFGTQRHALHQFVSGFVKGEISSEIDAQHNARFFLLLGYPGQGKTSFCKRLLYDLLPQAEPENLNANALLESHVFLVQIRNIGIQDSFSNLDEKLLKHINKHINLGKTTIKESIFQRSLLVLDGLDELAMHKHSSLQAIEEFCKELLRLQDNMPKLRIILTARYGYLDLEALTNQQLIVAQLAELNHTQQSDWLMRYKAQKPTIAFKQADLDKINDESNTQFRHLRELITQPILLHMVVLAELNIATSHTRASIYRQLFDKLTKRAWDECGQITILKHMTAQTLRQYVREIAFAIYTSEYEYMRKTDLEKLPASRQFMDSLNPKNLSEVLQYLMLTFYMQEINKQHPENTNKEAGCQYAIEFLHKSLQEYLVAERIWHELQAFGDRNTRTKQYKISEASRALKLVWEQFGQKALSKEIEQYLTEIIEEEAQANKAAIFERMIHFAPALLGKQFLHELKPHNPLHAALDTFRGYWVVLAALANGESTVTEDTKHGFVSLFKMYVAYSHRVWNLSKADLSEVNLRGIDLSSADLRGANLIGTDLRDAHLMSADLSGAKFLQADLRDAHLMSADLRDAHLMSADLSGAILMSADLSGAILSGAILSFADLSFADLSKANLRDADLSGANLREANLREADLIWADLSKANLREANLSKANLSKANLREANLSGANLSGANLSGADLREANLREADLREADLREADLSGADLSGADLREADLSGADLSFADLSGADLREADLREADLNRANLSFADLSFADLSGANLSFADLSGADLIWADLREANLREAHLMTANLREANLSRANLSRANLSRADLSRADLSRADLRETNLFQANLSGADLSEIYLSEIYLSEIYLSGIYLSGIYLSSSNLTGANLTGTDLSRANLKRVKNLTIEQLRTVHKLIDVEGLDEDIINQLKAEGLEDLFLEDYPNFYDDSE